MRPAVFLDRDDTLIVNRDLTLRPGERAGDLADPDRVRLLDGALDGCRWLKRAGFALVIFSNQGVVARGGATLVDVDATNDRVCDLLRDEQGGALIDAVYYCPFHPEGSVPGFSRDHPWRKPAPGMIHQAVKDLGLDLARSWVVGDAPRDLEAGTHAGIDDARLVLLDERTPDVAAAALRILAAVAPSERASLSLRAEQPAALADAGIRATVQASAEALAERTGIRLLDISIEDGLLKIELEGSEFVAVGFAAELRRLTNAWHRRQFDCVLWPEPAGES